MTGPRRDEDKAGPRRDDPAIPAGITGGELDRSVKAELRSLPRSLADLVAQHLVASGRFIDDDPELAYRHARTARRLASRLGGVREAVAITAYLAEHYDEALTEFRAVRRMTGNQEVLPMMADCERALGRPEKALALAREKQVNDLELGSQIEMLIVAAGARRDLGQTAAAIQTLEVPELTKRTRAEWLPRLRYAYADALQEAGRTEEALVWFHRAAGVDGEGLTGAAERAAELEGLQFTDLDDDDDDEDEDNYLEEVVADEVDYVTSEDEPAAGVADDTALIDTALIDPALVGDGLVEEEQTADGAVGDEPTADGAVDEGTAIAADQGGSNGPSALGEAVTEDAEQDSPEAVQEAGSVAGSPPLDSDDDETAGRHA